MENSSRQDGRWKWFHASLLCLLAKKFGSVRRDMARWGPQSRWNPCPWRFDTWTDHTLSNVSKKFKSVIHTKFVHPCKRKDCVICVLRSIPRERRCWITFRQLGKFHWISWRNHQETQSFCAADTVHHSLCCPVRGCSANIGYRPTAEVLRMF